MPASQLASDNPYPSVLYKHTSNTAISVATWDHSRLFFDDDGTLKKKNQGGTVTSIEGGLSNPMTTAEDIIKGGASGTPARLALGASNTVLASSNSALAYVKAADIVFAPNSLRASAAPTTADNFAAGWRRGSFWINGTDIYMMTNEVSATWTQVNGGGGSSSFVGCKAYHNTTQSCSTGVLTDIAFNSEEFDTDAIHDPSTNNDRFTVPAGKAGKWRFTVFVYIAAIAAGKTYQINFEKNDDGTELPPAVQQYGAEGQKAAQSSGVFILAEGDYIKARFYHDVGSSINIGHASAFQAQNQMVAEFLGA